MSETTTNTDTPRTELLTIPEVARELRVSRATAYRLINERRLSSLTIGTRRRVSRAMLDAYLAASTIEAVRDE